MKQARSARGACLTATPSCDFLHRARPRQTRQITQIPMPTSQPSNPAASAAAPGGASRLILFATVFFDLLGFGIVIPFLPMYAERLGIGAGAIGLLLSAYSITQFIFAPLLGRLSDRIGRRPIIMLGSVGLLAQLSDRWIHGSFAGLLISRAVHGACAGTISTAQAYVADTTEESKRAQAMGMIGAAFGLGFVLGPAVGGLLGAVSLRTPVLFAAALTFANLIFAAVWLPESLRTAGRRADAGAGPDAREDSRQSSREGLRSSFDLPRRLGRHRAIAPLFVVAFLITFAIAALEGPSPSPCLRCTATRRPASADCWLSPGWCRRSRRATWSANWCRIRAKPRWWWAVRRHSRPDLRRWEAGLRTPRCTRC